MRKYLTNTPCCLLVLVTGCPFGAGILDGATAVKESSSGAESSTSMDSTESTDSTEPTTGSNEGGLAENPTTATTSTSFDSTPDETSSSTGTPHEPVCGDGKKDKGEQCDPLFCSDENVEPEEGMKCTPDARKASDCYYATVCTPEEGCLNSCVLASCGDGQINSPGMIAEECDNGGANKMANDETSTYEDCINVGGACVRPKCGDGVVNVGEQCDDGPAGVLDLNDGCSEVCQNVYVAFVTSKKYGVGSDSEADLKFNSVSSADKRCQEAAMAGKLTGTYRAWLSDDSGPLNNSKEWLPPAAIKNRDGVVVVSSGTELLLINDAVDNTSKKLLITLDLDENGESAREDAFAWTGTTQTGSPASFTCQGWKKTMNDSPPYALNGSGGLVSAQNTAWTNFDVKSCAESHPIYCIRSK